MKTALLLLAILAAPARATTFTLTISTAGPVSTVSVVTSTPSGIVCPPTCTAPFTSGSTVTVGAVTSSTMSFVGWGNATGCRNNLKSCNVLIVAPSTVTATFAPRLSLSFSGNGLGSVNVAAVGVSSRVYYSTGAAPSGIWPKGTQVVLTRSTGTASSFVGWTSSVGGCGTASTCTVTMNSYVSVVATFTATSTVGISSFTIKVVLPNAGGIVYSSPAGITCGSTNTPCSFGFVSGGSVRFTTQALSGYRFAGWANGGCAGFNPCVITSTSPLQGIGGKYSPAAFFYPTP